KSLSSPGGGGYNELRIEDRKGQEQIFVHAQRDWDENIQHDQKIRVGHQRHDTVEANSYSEFKAEEHRTTHAERKVEVRASDHLTVANDQHLKIASGQFVEAGQEIHLSSGLKVVLEAGAELTLKGGGSFLKLDASGVTLSGANVRVNSGGSPGNGSGAAPLLPGPLRQADSDKAGALAAVAGAAAAGRQRQGRRPPHPGPDQYPEAQRALLRRVREVQGRCL
ncbi:bacteriophage T4 gp5 trimerisation domain-containing protein, partial [Pseudomonas aeruginosa]|uniref:bacteriophage T4 gp5 trimerisation domain-containing protein n=1 Tax=Pseudomonas aeruginosa TaxID=287 RepID=UPI003BF619B5